MILRWMVSNNFQLQYVSNLSKLKMFLFINNLVYFMTLASYSLLLGIKVFLIQKALEEFAHPKTLNSSVIIEKCTLAIYSLDLQ